MTKLEIAEGAREAYARWRIGLLEMGELGARSRSPALEGLVRRVEESLEERLGGKSRKELAATRPLDLYSGHFGRRGRAYPVLLQAEAIASRGRRLEMPDPLVLAMFAAELESLLLTAGHDLDALKAPLVLALADGASAMPTLGGSEKTPPEGDLIMRDAEGLVASVLLGPDSRTRMAPSTSRALFVVYSPPGIGAEELEAGLDRIEEAVALACPGARASGRRALVLGAEV
jgi:hypothetical protein